MQHRMRIQYPLLGDKHVTWDPADEKSVSEARKAFDDAIKRGHKAFGVVRNATAGAPITEFDPTLSEIILVAGLQGG